MRATGRLAGVLLASAGWMWALGPAALAQDPPPATSDTIAAERAATDDDSEEIVVTARRRSETLFETPATVTAVSGNTLRKFGAADMSSMIQLVPNAIIPADPQGFQTYINIRGIRQVDPQAEPNFGVYRNGIYAGGQRTNFGAQVDVERFEVLRGPQGGLYGRDAVGGAINVIYATPTDELEGYALFSYGRYDRTEFEGAVSLPISDNFGLRVAGWNFHQEEGEYYNIFRDEEIDRMDDSGVRLSARWDIGEAWSVLWIAEYQDTDIPSARTFAPNGIPDILGIITSPSETPETVQRDTPLRADTSQFYLSQDISYETKDSGTFHLLAAYRDYELESTEDQDYTALPPTAGPLILQQTMFRDEGVENVYVELVWESPQDQALTWVAGMSYFHEQFDFSRVIETNLDFNQLGFFGFPPIGVQTASGALPGPGTKITTEAYSIFADFDYAISDRFSLTASLRYNSDEKELDYSQYVFGDPATLPFFLALFGSVIPPFDLHDSPTFDHLSPGIGFHYEMDDNVNFYGLISDGFRAGGFNTTSTSPDLIPFGSEEATNYELGVKTQWYGGDLGVNLAVFFMEQSDLLVRRNDPVVPNPFSFTYLENAGDAETFGVELEVFARLADWLTGAATVGYLDAEYTSGKAFENELKGKNIPFTRDWTINLRLDADIPIEGAWSFIGTVNYRGEYGGSMDDGANPVDYEDLDRLDASIGIAYEDTRLVAYVENAFDDVIPEFIFGNGATSTSYGETYGVRISTEF